MRIRVVICGTFHQDISGLKRLFRELEASGCRILSPINLDFTTGSDDFVRTKHEYEFSVLDIEKFHLRAMCEADMIWLHAPVGYVGISTAFEIGWAVAHHVPVFSNIQLTDEMLQTQITVCSSVFDSLELITSQVSEQLQA